MGWEKCGKRQYFYRSNRHGNKVTKTYYGAGQGGQIAAAVHALYLAEGKAEAETARREKKILGEAVSVIRRLNEWCNLITTAALLAEGFHRPRRHAWRTWKNARKLPNDLD